MKFIKKFEIFKEEFEFGDQGTKTKPAPTTTPGIKPGTRPGRPSPIRRDKPSVNPNPKATVEDVVDRFISLSNDKGEDIKKYVNK